METDQLACWLSGFSVQSGTRLCGGLGQVPMASSLPTYCGPQDPEAQSSPFRALKHSSLRKRLLTGDGDTTLAQVQP